MQVAETLAAFAYNSLVKIAEILFHWLAVVRGVFVQWPQSFGTEGVYRRYPTPRDY